MWNPFQSFHDYFNRWRPWFENRRVVVLDKVPVPEKPVLPAVKPQPPNEDNVQEYYFKEEILDQLDQSLFFMRRLKRFDPDSYDYFSKIGIGLLPDSALSGEILKLSPWFLKTRPGRGGAFLSRQMYTKDMMFPRFIYFTKFEPNRAPVVFQRRSCGDIYEITVVFDERNDGMFKFGGFGQSFAMWIGDDGSIVMLREHYQDIKTVRTKRRTVGKNGKIWKRGETFSIPRRQWIVSPLMTSWSEDLHICKEFKGNPEKLAMALFTQAASYYEAMNAGVIRVYASRDGITVPFSVNIKRTPYFFKDRNLVTTVKGKKARIFHVVRPHVRANGSVVHMHFRGLRHFMWNGYDVRITVPGLHHEMIHEFGVPSISEDKDHQVIKPAITSAQIAKRFVKHIEGTRIDEAFKD